MRSFPGEVAETRRAVRDVALGAVALGVATTRRPRVAIAATGVLAGFVSLSTWRSRPGSGLRRGLPPGRLTGVPDAHLDEHHLMRCARRHGPVFKDDLGPSTPMVCVTGLERARRLLTDHETGVAPIHYPFSRVISGGFVREATGDSHRRLRRTLASGLTGDAVRRHDPGLVGASRRTLERFVAASPCHPGPILEETIFDLWMGVFFGMAHDDATTLRELRRLYGIVHPLGFFQDLEHEAAAVEELRRIVTAPSRNSSSGDDEGLVARSVLAAIEVAGHRVREDPAVVDNLIFLAVTTAADVAALLTWIVAQLATHPDWVTRVRADGCDGSAPARLATPVVSETLRLEQSERVTRQCVADGVTAEGYRIPKGWLVRACVHESHRDPAVFDRPDDYDPARFVGRRFGPGEYAPFGLDRRNCLGETLTRRTAEWFVTEMCRGYDAVVVVDGPPEFGRWRHWAPSPLLRIDWTALGDQRLVWQPALPERPRP